MEIEHRSSVDSSLIPEPKLPSSGDDPGELEARLQEWFGKWPEWLSSEEWRLKPVDPRVIVTDLSPLPLLLAERLGIPGLFLGHFNWFEEYASLMEITGVADEIARAYETSVVAFIPPIASINTVFPLIQEIPLITPDLSHDEARLKRKEARDAYAQFIIYADASLFPRDGFRKMKEVVEHTGKVKWLAGSPDRKISHDFASIGAADIAFLEASYSSISMAIRSHTPFICLYSPDSPLQMRLIDSFLGYGIGEAIGRNEAIHIELAKLLNTAIEQFCHLPDLLRLDGRQFIWEKLKEISEI